MDHLENVVNNYLKFYRKSLEFFFAYISLKMFSQFVDKSLSMSKNVILSAQLWIIDGKNTCSEKNYHFKGILEWPGNVSMKGCKKIEKQDFINHK